MACVRVDYTAATPATLGQIATRVLDMQPGEDEGMWQTMRQHFQTFQLYLQGPPAPTEPDIEYKFVGCFVNSYSNASHNEDLWQSVNDCAVAVLNGRSSTSRAAATSAAEQ